MTNSIQIMQTADVPLTMAVVGCGRLGNAILCSLLKTLAKDLSVGGGHLPYLPNRFLACVRTQESAARLKAQFNALAIPKGCTETGNPISTVKGEATVEVWHGRNIEAVRQAKMILLGCQPPQVPAILAEEGMADALRGKLLLNICAGISESCLREQIYSQLKKSSNDEHADEDANMFQDYYIVHAMPNAASAVSYSATILSPWAPTFPETYITLVNWVFHSIGSVTEVPLAQMNAASITAGSTLGFLAPVLQGIAAGAVVEGLEYGVALRLAAQAMRGAAEIVLTLGESPEELMDKVATPGGCTAKGLETLLTPEWKGSVAQAYEKSIRDAIVRAVELGGSSASNGGHNGLGQSPPGLDTESRG